MFIMRKGKVESLDGFISLILPAGILEYFDFTHCTYTEKSMCIHLDEKNIIPDEFKSEVYKSVGFQAARQLNDFPIRGKVVTLSVRRRRWLVRFKDGTDRKVSRDWSIIQQGTNITCDFAAFLKAIS